jgi:dihydropteroate synthase
MGIVNVTPDSFSDGGRYLQTAGAVEHGMALVAAGADIVDVGGESTRPGARPVPVDVELNRVVPVVRELARAGTTVSIDTMHAEVARAALAAGALAVNDVSGGLADPAMAGLVADAQVPYVAMHWRAPSVDMQRHAGYGDVVVEVAEELSRRLDAFVEAGMDPRRIVLDPGLGFAKNAAHNWQLLARFDELLALGHPLLVGASRKSFLGALLATDDGPAAPDARDVATAAVSALAAAAGAYCVRVHDVRSTLDAVRVATAWADGGRAAGRPGPPEAQPALDEDRHRRAGRAIVNITERAGTATTTDQITSQVLAAVGDTTDERIGEIVASLIRHAHELARDVRLQPEELLAAANFLKRCGDISDEARHEFILLSDVLGLTTVVDTLAAEVPDGALETSVLGPFYRANAPFEPNGADIARGSTTANRPVCTAASSTGRAVRSRQPSSTCGGRTRTGCTRTSTPASRTTTSADAFAPQATEATSCGP